MEKTERKINGLVEQNDAILSVIKVLEEIKCNEYVSDSSLFYNDFNSIIERLKDETFRLAVVGEFSSGKSTFLNALIGRDLLKHGARETTATVTEIKNDFTQAKGTLMDVYFMDGRIEKDVSSEEMIEYTSTSSEKYSVAHEIDKVVIKSKIINDNSPVCFVDTPGLNGIADQHREKTVEQIKSAHACIYLMQVRGLGESDIDFLKYICKYQHNIIFVQNFIDELKKLEGETTEEKIEEQKKIIEEKIVSECDELQYQIVAVSSRKALISRSEEFITYNDEVLTQELRQKLYEESGFEKVFDVIEALMKENRQKNIKQRNTVSVALKLLESLKRVITFHKTIEEEEWNNSVEGRKKRNYEELLQFLKENKQRNIDRLDNFVEAEISDISRECRKSISKKMEEVNLVINKKMDAIKEVDEFKYYVKKEIQNDLYLNLYKIEDDINSHLNIQFDNLLSSAVLRIEQYTNFIRTKNEMEKLEKFDVKVNLDKDPFLDVMDEENEIERLRVKLYEKKSNNENLNDKRKNKIPEQIMSFESEIHACENTISKQDEQKRNEIWHLGARPKPERVEREEIYYENRGGLGILDAIFGEKKKTRYVSYDDDSKGKMWEKEKSDIERKYEEEKIRINAQIKKLEEKISQCEWERNSIRNTENARIKEINSLEELISAKRKQLKVKREQVKGEYLRNNKGIISDRINEYLETKVKLLMRESFELAIEKNKKGVKEIIFSLFDISYQERIKSLESMIYEAEGQKTYEKTGSLLNLIEQSENKLEEYLCQQ